MGMQNKQSSSQTQRQTLQAVKRKDAEAEASLRRKGQDKRRKNAFQRHDNTIRPNDIIVNTQHGKIKLESEEINYYPDAAKQETEEPLNEIVKSEEYEMRIVEEEVDIPNDMEEESSTFPANERSSEEFVMDVVVSSPSTENGSQVQVQVTDESHSLELNRLGETLAINKQLTSKVKVLENLLVGATKEKDHLANELFKKNEEIKNLKFRVGELENEAASCAESKDDDDCNSCSPEENKQLTGIVHDLITKLTSAQKQLESLVEKRQKQGASGLIGKEPASTNGESENNKNEFATPSLQTKGRIERKMKKTKNIYGHNLHGAPGTRVDKSILPVRIRPRYSRQSNTSTHDELQPGTSTQVSQSPIKECSMGRKCERAQGGKCACSRSRADFACRTPGCKFLTKEKNRMVGHYRTHAIELNKDDWEIGTWLARAFRPPKRME